MMTTIDDLKRVAEVEFSDIVKETFPISYKLRIVLKDNSFIDVNLSKKISDKFGFHWECRDREGTVFRYDNFPDKDWQNISTFPYHFHRGSQKNVEASPFPIKIVEGFRSFMEFIRNQITK